MELRMELRMKLRMKLQKDLFGMPNCNKPIKKGLSVRKVRFKEPDSVYALGRVDTCDVRSACSVYSRSVSVPSMIRTPLSSLNVFDIKHSHAYSGSDALKLKRCCGEDYLCGQRLVSSSHRDSQISVQPLF